MCSRKLIYPLMLAVVPWAASASIALGAANITNSLKGFTGNSTVPATQTAVASAGFNFTSPLGQHEDPPGTVVDPTINFDSGGAHFGDVFANDEGRNYIRTNDSDYANHSFVAEVTFEAPFIDFQDVYFGMGAGNYGAFRTPDYTTQTSSVMYWGESEIATPNVDIFRTNNGSGQDTFTDAPALGDGTHRVRLSYDWFQKSATFAFDLNYAGGAFTADVTAPAANVSALYGPSGWPTEQSRIYFGGDDGTILKDFSVNVTTGAMVQGDLNSSGTITSADWMILRANQHTDLSGLSFQQAYFLGDLTSDKANNFDDFVAFKTLFEAANGAGSFAAMVASVPEPTTFLLTMITSGMVLLGRRRAAR